MDGVIRLALIRPSHGRGPFVRYRQLRPRTPIPEQATYYAEMTRVAARGTHPGHARTASAQETIDPEWRAHRGFAVKVYVSQMNRWSLTEHLPEPGPQRLDFDGATGLRLDVSYAFHPNFALGAVTERSLRSNRNRDFGTVSVKVVGKSANRLRIASSLP